MIDDMMIVFQNDKRYLRLVIKGKYHFISQDELDAFFQWKDLSSFQRL